MAVRLIYNHIEHHARHSGYDQLAKHVEGQAYRPGVGAGWPLRKRLYHVFDAERDLAADSRDSRKTIATFHQPPEVADFGDDIRQLRAAIVVARSQIPHMTRFLPPERVFHVPHGVDVDYWSPDPAVTKHDRPSFLFVGSRFRDIEMLCQVVALVAADHPDVRFRVVTSEPASERLSALPQTEVLSSISDAELLQEYRRAWAVFLPLKASTASNTLLEAMACGTGLVSTEVGGVPEYVNEHSAVLVPPGDTAGAVTAIARIAGDPEQMRKMGVAARERSLRFRLEHVGELMSYVYRRLLGKRCTDILQHSKSPYRGVCLLTEEYPAETGWGGIATYNYNLAQGLAEAGHRVLVIAGCLEQPSVVEENGVEVHRVKFRPRPGFRRWIWNRIVRPVIGRYPEFTRRLEFALAARKRFRRLFDQVPIHVLESPEYYGSAYFIQKLKKRCPVTVKLHTGTEVNCWINSLPVTRDVKLSNILEKGSTRRAELLTAPSRKIMELIPEKWLQPCPPITHLEYPINTDLYSPAADAAKPDSRHFLFTGRMEVRKGVHILLEAFNRVAEQIPDFELHLAGHDTPTFSRNGEHNMYFKDYMETMSLAPTTLERIKFIGRVPLRELIPLYRDAYACIIPSVSFENFPNSCLEAISCGKAVIVSDRGGMTEMAPPGVSGLSVKADDVDTLAEAIEYMAKNPDKVREFGENARNVVLERYATAPIVERTMAVFEGMIEKGPYR